jgi:hypothetical protein
MTNGERREPISFRKDEPNEPLDFDPYRFGAPEHPVPPEYAPPGYRPAPTNPPPPQFPPGPPQYPGYWAPPPESAQYPRPRTGNGKAIAALVLGIVSIVLCWLSLFDIIPAVLGLIFGILGRNDSLRHPERGGRGMAVAGIACAVVGALLAGLFTAWAVHRFRDCYDSNASSSQVRTCIQQHL